MKITSTHVSRILFVVAISFFATHPALAGRYEIVMGKGVEVCEAYAANLSSFKPTEPMRCSRPANPKLEGFQKPQWERIDGLKSFDLIVNVDHLLEPTYYEHSERLKKSRVDGLRAAMEAEPPAVHSITTIDIDNDGNPEPVFYFHHECPLPGTAGPWGTSLIILKGDRSSVDYKKNEVIAQGRGVSRNYYHLIFDVFSYKGVVYFDYSNDDGGPLRVMSTRNETTREVCQLEYRKN